MGTWWVSYPTAGVVTVEVEADTEADAIEAGWSKVGDEDAEHTWEAMELIVPTATASPSTWRRDVPGWWVDLMLLLVFVLALAGWDALADLDRMEDEDGEP